MKKVQITVLGNVQGVGFRFLVKEYACKNDIKGFVMNLNDGNVSIIAQGTNEALNKMIEWIKKNPLGTIVKNVVVNDYLGNENFDDFQIRRIDI